MESSTPETILATDYKLAMKSFINKEFQRSFPLIRKSCAQAILTFQKGYMNEELFVKIVVLYLTELALVLSSRDSQLFMLPKRERDTLITELKGDELFLKIHEIFGSISEFPSILFYQLYLVYYTCTDIFNDPDYVLHKFEEAYSNIDFSTHNSKLDKYLARFLDMYIYNVLPGAEKWQTAYAIAQSNPSIDKQKALLRIKEIESVSIQEKKVREQNKKDRQQHEKKLLEQEQERQRKEREEKSLKYKSLKQIKQESDSSSNEKFIPQDRVSTMPSVAELREKVTKMYLLMRGNLIKYSPVLAAVLAILLVVLRVVSVKRINLREKLKETLAMAMKVTYM